MHARKIALAIAVVALGACADQQLVAPAADLEPAASKTPGSSITITGCAPDCRATLQSAVNTYETVRLTSGTFPVSGTVTVPSNTRVIGAGATATVIRQSSSGQHLFNVTTGTTSPVQNVTFDSLRFVGTSTNDQMAIRATHAVNLKVRHNRADSIGLLITFPQAGHTYSTMTASALTRNVEVLRNVAHGPTGGIHGAITFYYARDVVVTHNEIYNYTHGIQWWGGDANHNVDGAPGNPRWATNYVINHNTVHNVGDPGIANSGGGIWGGMGDSIEVAFNDVRNCLDLCLDAEGSHNVTFHGNWVVNAGLAAPLAVFFHSRNVVFSWNHVIQDGSMGNVLFTTVNPTIQEYGVTIHVNNNTFEYTGSTGVGVIGKEASEFIGFFNNTLVNTVVDFGGCYSQCQWNGEVEMGANNLSFTRNAGAPAIKVGHNWTRNALIGSNTISSTVSQSQPAVYAIQDGPYSDYTRIFDNDISGFSRAVEVESSTAPAKTFVVEDNRAGSGTFAAYLSGASHTLINQNNSWNTSGGPGPGPCDLGCPIEH